MIKPFKNGFQQTQGFGENPDTYAQFGLKGHNGLDYATPTGTPILASISGMVIEAVKSGDVGYGKYVKIENDEYGSLTAHFQRVDVEIGQQVTEGQQIGLSDNTGFSTGPHLHWGIFSKPRDRGNGYDGYIDQTDLITSPSTDTIPVNKKDYEVLITKLDQQTTQIHELGVERDALKAKADNLGTFLETLASKLNCPKEQSSIMQAIEEILSTGGSIGNLSNQITTLNKVVSEQNKTIDTLAKAKQALEGTLESVRRDLARLQTEYQDLVSASSQPTFKFKIWNYLIEIWRR